MNNNDAISFYNKMSGSRRPEEKHKPPEHEEAGRIRFCTKCGKPCDTSGKRCSTCQNYMRSYLKNYTPKKSEPRKKPSLTIGQVSKMAAERGISYGQMVLLLEKGESR